MADKEELKGGLSFDTTNAVAGITELNRNIKILDSGFKASAAGIKDWSNTTQGNEERAKALNEILDLQRQKLNNLNEQYKKTSEESGKSSTAAENLQIKINKEQEAFNKNTLELQQCNEKLKTFSSDAGKAGISADGLTKNLSGIGGGITSGIKTAGAAIAGVGAAAVGAAAGVYKIASESGESASQLKVLSEKTGMSTSQLQIYQYTADKLGISLDTITGVQSKLVKNMAAAQNGTKAQSNAFKELGISVTDSHGQLKNQNDVFSQSITALGNVKNETQRNALAMTIFGKSATELNPLIKAGGKELNEYAKQAEESGAVMSDASINGLAQFKDGTVALKDSVKGMTGTLAAMALPMLNQFTGLIGKLSGALNIALKTGNFSQLGTVLANGISSAVSQLSGIVSKITPIVMQVISSIINAVVKSIPTVLPALTSGVLLLITSLAQILQANGPMLISAGVQAIVTLISGFTKALPQIAQAAITTILTLVNSLAAQLPTLIPIAVQAIMTIANGLIANLPQIINSAIQIIISLAQGIINALPQLIAQIPQIIAGIITGLTNALPQLIAAAPKIIVALIVGIAKALPQIIEEAPKIIEAIITGIISAIPVLLTLGPEMLKEIWEGLSKQDWPTIGSNILKGIVNGFGQIGGWIWGKIQEAGNTIVNGFKSFFGIHSPSTVMRDQIGVNLGKGIAAGVDQTVPLINSSGAKIGNSLGNGTINAFKAKMNQIIGAAGTDSETAAKKITESVSQQTKEITQDRDNAVNQLQNQFTNLSREETAQLKNTTKAHKSAVEESYTAKKDGLKKEIDLRKEQATKEIDQIKTIGQAAKDELDKEVEDRKQFVTSVNDLESNIEKALKARYEAEEKEQENTLNKRLSALDTWKDKAEKETNDYYDNAEAKAEEAATVQEAAIQKQIDALDAESTAEDRASKLKEYTDKITDLQAQIKFSHDDYNKSQLQKSLDSTTADYQKQIADYAKEDKKSALQAQLEQIKTNLDAQKKAMDAEKKTELADIDEIYTKKKTRLENQLTNLKNYYSKAEEDANLEAEAEKMIMQNNQNDIIALLQSYGDAYKAAGTTLGDMLVQGFQPAIDNIKSMIASITASIQSAKEAALEAKESSMRSESRSHNDNRSYSAKVYVGSTRSSASEISRQSENAMRRMARGVG